MSSRKKSPPQSNLSVVIPSGPRWLLPTNHHNLMYWLAAGLMLPEDAMSKYYADCLRTTPGWLPLFRDAVAQTALDTVTAERGIPVLLDFDLSRLSGKVQVVAPSGEISECQFPDELPENVSLILAPLPLPAHWIGRATFLTADARNEYQVRREEFPNVSTIELPLAVGQYPVVTFMNERWLPPDWSTPSHSLSALPVLHEGAILALLYTLGNKSDLALAVAKAALADQQPLLLKSATFRDAINQALAHDGTSQQAESRVRLYWGVVDHLVEILRQRDPKVSLQQAVLDYLNNQAGNEPEGSSSRKRLLELADDLHQTLTLGNSTISELFKRHPGPFAHALLLFFLRRHTDEMLNFDTPGVTLSDADWLAASILFGLREDWMDLPEALRAAYGLYPAIAHRMAINGQRSAAYGIELGAPPVLMPFRELFSLRDGKWSSVQQQAALNLARQQKWLDVIETRVRLGAGSYRLEVGKGGGVQLIFPGEVKAVEVAVDPERFLEHLAENTWPLDPRVDQEIRSLLGSR